MGADGIVAVHPLFQEDQGGSIPTSALQLHIAKCGIDTAMMLNAQWHSVFPYTNKFQLRLSGRSLFFAATYQGSYYAVAIWTRPIAANRMRDGSRLLELRRMAIAPGAPKNTASRMLRVMRNLIVQEYPDILRLVSYQDTEQHTGTIYKAAGWHEALRSKFVDWSTHKTKPGKITQSTAEKVRWEYELTTRGRIGDTGAQTAPIPRESG